MEKSITREELCIDKLRHIYRMTGRTTMDIAVFVLPLVVPDRELPVLFYKGNDDRGLILSRLFIGHMGVIV